MRQIIDRRVYDTETAKLIADSEFSDGANRLTGGRGSRLYRTAKGAYFYHHETCWQGEHDRIEPIDTETAEGFYETALSHHVAYAEAFPGVEVVEA